MRVSRSGGRRRVFFLVCGHVWDAARDAAGIAGVSRRRGPCTTRRAVRARPAPDRVERRFEADEPNRLWVADIECHEALTNRAVMREHRRVPVAAGMSKLRAA